MITAVAIVAVAALVVYLRAVVVLAFGSVLVAVALRIGSNAVRRATGLSDSGALAAEVLGALALLVFGIVLLGDPIADQFAALRSALPAALEATSRWLNSHAVGLWLLRWWDSANAGVEWTRVLGIAGSTVGALGSALLMIVTGLYLAVNPELYRRGLLLLVLPRQRSRVDRALAAAGDGLSRWLFGQAVAMVLVGAMTAAGLAAIGMPLALPLGIIAGILEFVPFFGALAAGALTVLLAFTQGATQAAYAALVCFFVQHFEVLCHPTLRAALGDRVAAGAGPDGGGHFRIAVRSARRAVRGAADGGVDGPGAKPVRRGRARADIGSRGTGTSIADCDAACRRCGNAAPKDPQ